MARFAGDWMNEPRITGTLALVVEGRGFLVPADSEIKFVRGAGREVAHVKHDGRVTLLCSQGELWEPDEDAYARALEHQWKDVGVAGRPIRVSSVADADREARPVSTTEHGD